MIRRKNWYAVHRWIGLVVSLQLLAWSVGGFVFSILDIEAVRGNTDRSPSQVHSLQMKDIKVSPQVATGIAQSNGCGDAVDRILLRMRLNRTVYEFFADGDAVCAVDAYSGSFIEQISPEEAKSIALEDFAHKATVRTTTLFTQDAPNEYRGGPLPAYQVLLDHPREPHIYVSAITGEVTKRRNKLWRTFDFFWMLHIMDYRDRDNFNHWLLTGMSVLAILTSISGFVLWWWRIPRRGSVAG